MQKSIDLESRCDIVEGVIWCQPAPT